MRRLCIENGLNRIHRKCLGFFRTSERSLSRLPDPRDHIGNVLYRLPAGLRTENATICASTSVGHPQKIRTDPLQSPSRCHWHRSLPGAYY
ncbi:hypothetical protein PISMIDRAFT_690713 [Pisolithus microcarpus 441]|uniref:Uncharacterized protein n=1 Tax=Pisolithus microcarpus 441 TaxID=765257 RepID=A0A0C9XF25_9AGAM|nr:hypothetical protein PISMIDRAFT_690713 [Pisolithus microcarpus 441]